MIIRFNFKILIFMLVSSMVLAAEEKKIPLISGWGWLTMGQVVNTEANKNAIYPEFDNQWLSDIQAGIKITAPVTSRSTCRLHLQSSLQFPVITVTAGADNSEPLQKYFTVSILEASMQTYWEVGNNDTILTEFGYFPVKYNPDAMNLGEYLFRSNTYPGLLVSGFEIADRVKMAGFHTGYLKNAYSGKYKVDLFLNTETESYPTFDLTLSYTVEYSTPNLFYEMSLGISHHHLVAFDQKRIIPGKSASYNTTATSFVDSITGDTTDYTFRGTKMAARVSFDLKKICNSKIFGDNDLKLYAEMAILGLKDYPGWYNNIKERIPIMVGFNLPTFRLFDVLAFELEYYPNPYQNAFHFIWKSNSPVPYFGLNTGMDYYSDWERKKDDDWKWSVYASKRIKFVKVSGQIASDHTSKSLYLPAGKKLYNEMVPRTKDWYYMLRCGFNF